MPCVEGDVGPFGTENAVSNTLWIREAHACLIGATHVPILRMPLPHDMTWTRGLGSSLFVTEEVVLAHTSFGMLLHGNPPIACVSA